jgi:protein O-mannosyl-transferase
MHKQNKNLPKSKQAATLPLNMPKQKSTVLTLNQYKIIIFMLGILLYAYTISFDFTLDDTLMITSNDLTTQGISGLSDIFSKDAFAGFFGEEKDLVAGGRYRPLTHAMFAIEYELFGVSAMVGHFMNILLYALLGLIVFNTLRHIFKTEHTVPHWMEYIPFTATLLFMAHPLHTEVVSNIKGRDEIISMGGSMLALLYSLKYIHKQKMKYLIFSFFSMLVAIFSKENAITFVAIIPLSMYFFTQARKSEYVKTMLPILLASFIFILARYNALGFWITGSGVQTEILNNPFLHSSKADEIATVIYTWLLYLKLMIFPHPLTHDYYPWHLEVLSSSSPMVLASLVVILGLLGISFFHFKKKHILSYGILFFVITFSIQSNLLFNIGTFMNERFVFVALLGFCMILAYYFKRYHAIRGRSIMYLMLALMSFYTLKTVIRSAAWKDNYTLFTTDVKVSVNSAKCNVSAGESIIDRAEKEKNPEKARSMFQEAYAYLLHAQKIHPTYYGAYDLAGKAAFHLDDFRSSFEHYKACLEINPTAPVPITNIHLVAIAASQKGRVMESIEMLKWLTAFSPDSLHYVTELSNMYERAGNITEAMRTIQDLLETHPDYSAAWAKAGEIYGKHMNDLKNAEFHLLRAFELKPDDFNVLENLGIVFGMQSKYVQSIEYFNKALALDSTVDRLHTNIGNTYMMMGELEKAEFHFGKID